MNIQPLLSRRMRGLKPSPIRKLNPIMRMPGMISLGDGYPNAKTFAFGLRCPRGSTRTAWSSKTA